ncbi:hypothetical protein PFAG_01011 [Plasmodium falciparum Santa Lucia]|uniref:phosphatidylinositol 3-kinase n=1 Tax=Plasmodium falciparum Santa Lucia TaxID=478859 RepID=W7GAT9_PLAFA|nr:hypothetical protein PFAG_01011 [Plasmodium falciparum Santa Lucia]
MCGTYGNMENYNVPHSTNNTNLQSIKKRIINMNILDNIRCNKTYKYIDKNKFKCFTYYSCKNYNVCKKIIEKYKLYKFLKKKKIEGYMILNFLNFNKELIYYNEHKKDMSTLHDNLFDVISNNQNENVKYNHICNNNKYDWFFNSFDYVGNLEECRKKKKLNNLYKTILTKKKRKKMNSNLCVINKIYKYPIKYCELNSKAFVFFIIKNVGVHKITYYSYNKLFSKDGVLNQGIQICKLYHVNKNKKIKQIIFEALKNKITFSYDNNPNNIKKKIYKFLKKNCAYHDLIKLFYFKGHKQREKCNKKLNMEKTFGVHKSSRYNYKTYKKKKKIDMCKNYCDDILDTYNSKYYKGELSGQHKHIKMTGEQKEEHHIKYTHLNFNHGKDETFYKELYKCNYIEKYISKNIRTYNSKNIRCNNRKNFHLNRNKKKNGCVKKYKLYDERNTLVYKNKIGSNHFFLKEEIGKSTKKLNDIFEHISNYTNRISKNINITNKNRYDDYPFDFLSKDKIEYISMLSPTINEIKTLNTILTIPLIKMNEYEKNCIWRFRFQLLNRKETLGKFLKSINWNNKEEEEEAIILLNKWAKPGIENCIELFYSHLHHYVIKKYIIDIIKNSKKEEIKLYLFQLVQSLRTFNYQHIDNLFINTLIQKCIKSKKLSIYFYWFLLSEAKDKIKGKLYLHIHKLFINKLMTSNIRKNKIILDILKNQNRFRNQLLYLTKIAKNKTDRIQNKTRKLRNFLFYYRTNYGYINIKDFIKNNIFISDHNVYDFLDICKMKRENSLDTPMRGDNIGQPSYLGMVPGMGKSTDDSKNVYGDDNKNVYGDNKNVYGDDNKNIYGDDSKNIYGDDNKNIFSDDNKNLYSDNNNNKHIRYNKYVKNISYEHFNEYPYDNKKSRNIYTCNKDICNSIYYLDNELTINYDIKDDLYFFQYKRSSDEKLLNTDLSNDSNDMIHYIDDSKNVKIERNRDNSFFSNFLQFNDNLDFFLNATYSDEDNNYEILDDSINFVQKQKIKKIKTPLILPIDPNIELLSFLPEQSYVLRSSLYPIVIACLVRKKIKLYNENYNNLIINNHTFYKNDQNKDNIINNLSYDKSYHSYYNSQFIKTLQNSFESTTSLNYHYNFLKCSNNNIFYKNKKIERIKPNTSIQKAFPSNENILNRNQHVYYSNNQIVHNIKKMNKHKRDDYMINEKVLPCVSNSCLGDKLMPSHDKMRSSHDKMMPSHDKMMPSHDKLMSSHDKPVAPSGVSSLGEKKSKDEKKNRKKYNEIYQLSIKKYIYKAGDDLRQDHLVIQIIYVMDNIWKRYGLDLKMTLYRVLALSTDDGFIEFVDYAESISSIKKNYKGEIRQYFIDNSTCSSSPLGFDTEILQNFISSCAGYSVITYILGIGDRHLDNLMVTKDGRFFHIDFGYIFGEDPKPFSPPMKLCKEMIEAMGGAHSIGYEQFLKKCCLAYKYLRYHSQLIISLLDAMCDAGLKDMKMSPELCVLKVQEKFRLDLNDEAAEIYFLSVINASVKTLFPVVVDKLHEWALNWK